MDLFGHINNVSYFKFLQAGRVNFWESAGLVELLTSQNIGPVLAETGCKFLKPLQYPGSIEVRTGLAERRTTSFVLSQQIYDAAGTLCAEGRDVIVWFDYTAGVKIPLGAEQIVAMERLETSAKAS